MGGFSVLTSFMSKCCSSMLDMVTYEAPFMKVNVALTAGPLCILLTHTAPALTGCRNEIMITSIESDVIDDLCSMTQSRIMRLLRNGVNME